MAISRNVQIAKSRSHHTSVFFTSKAVFLRDATGLVKEMSLFDSIIFNLCVSAPGFGILLYTFYGPVSFPGVNLVVALFVATPFMLCHAVVAGQWMAAMPVWE